MTIPKDVRLLRFYEDVAGATVDIGELALLCTWPSDPMDYDKYVLKVTGRHPRYGRWGQQMMIRGVMIDDAVLGLGAIVGRTLRDNCIRLVAEREV